jgi:class 3 adenylate cyclase
MRLARAGRLQEVLGLSLGREGGGLMPRYDVQFVWNGDVAIAYQVIGDGPPDLVYVPPFASNLDRQWEFAPHARFLERLASFSRLIVLDRRGWGCSDRVTPGSFPPLEVAADDLIAVLDEVGSSQAALFSGGNSGFVGAIAAATYPDRFTALVLYAAAATWIRTEETPWESSPEEWRAQVNYWRDFGTRSFTEEWVRDNEPSLVGDAAAMDWLITLFRGTIGPGSVLAEFARYNSIDLRAILPAIRVPTLLLYRPANAYQRPERASFLASKIPDSRLVSLPGADYLPWVGEPDALLDEIEEFITGVRPAVEPDRLLATVLFTDIVDSTKKAAEIGDMKWKQLLATHHERTRSELVRHRGREVSTTGDGFFATFDGPARAVRCAQAIQASVRELGIELRAGAHTGEVELAGDDVQGLAVHIGARVGALAGPSEVLVSYTVKDLVAGSGLVFDDAGEHELKGVPDRWHLYRVVS